jgi:hypothetical protein
VIALFIGFTVLVSAGIEAMFAQAVQAFNNCRVRVGAGTLLTVVIVFSYAVVVAALLFSVGGGLAGRIPWQVVA